MKCLLLWRAVTAAAIMAWFCCGCGPADGPSPKSPTKPVSGNEQPSSGPGSEGESRPEQRVHLESIVRITTSAPGFSPAETETEVTRPIETAVLGIPDATRVRSVSRDGESIVWVEFAPGSDAYKNRQDVAERLDVMGAELPADVEAPLIASRSSGLILLLVLRERESEDETQLADTQLRTLADGVVRPRLLAISGVAGVSVLGGRRLRYEIVVDPERLAVHNVTLGDLTRAIKEANLDVVPGVATREYVVRSLKRESTVEDLEATVVAVRNGVPIRLAVLATVHARSVPERLSAQKVAPGREVWPGNAVLVAVDLQPGDRDPAEVSAKIDQRLESIELPTQVECLRRIPPELSTMVSKGIEHLQHDLPPDLEFRLATSRDLQAHLKLAGRRDYEIKVLGPDLDVLERTAAEIGVKLGEVPGIGELHVDRPATVPQLHVEIDRKKAARFGVSIRDVTLALRRASTGEVLCRAGDDQQEVDVVLAFPEGERESPDRLLGATVLTPTGQTVPLRQVVEISLTAEPLFFCHEQSQRYVTVRVRWEEALKAILPQLRKALAPLEARLGDMEGEYRLKYPPAFGTKLTPDLSKETKR